MSYIIGTDEAGYGPNLGPLSVCGTAWRIPDRGCELYESLSNIVAAETGEKDRLRIADSKAVYSPSGSIEMLETSVLSVLFSLTDRIPGSIEELADLICSDFKFEENGVLEWRSKDVQLPMAANQSTVEQLGTRFREVCLENDVELIAIECQSLFPGQFNEQVSQYGNKAELLSNKTLAIAAQLLDNCRGDTQIVCDKHGGRSRYLSLLNHCVTDRFVNVVQESRQLSVYRWSDVDRDIEIQFQAKGETSLPTALSSMIAKYFREVAMEIWNQFWQKEIPDIKPTRGYPVDAKRFKAEIESKQQALGISNDSIWRSR